MALAISNNLMPHLCPIIKLLVFAARVSATVKLLVCAARVSD